MSVLWDIALAVFGTVLGFVANDPSILPLVSRARRGAWAGRWWSVWQDTENAHVWNVDEGVFYHRFKRLKFKTISSSARQWEALGHINDFWFAGEWKSLRKLATARGSFMFKRPALESDFAGYFLSPTNGNDLVSIAAIFTQNEALVQRIAAAGDEQHSMAIAIVKDLLRA